MSSASWNADCGNGTYRNPVLYTDYSDPDAVRVGSDYYMVASSFSNVPGLPLLRSKDLVNWELVTYVLKKLPAKRYERPVHGCGVWAPSIRFHEGVFFVCFPMPDEGIYMCTATDPEGKWSDPVMIKEGPGWIDPCPFWDDDGKAYLVYGVAKSRIGYKSVLWLQEMRPNGLGLAGEPMKIFDGNENDQSTIEGPKLYKRNGYYYIFAPAGGVKTGWQTVLRSRDICGPYEYRVVLRQGESGINGPHQGAWVDTVNGEEWFLHFRDVYAAGRIVYLQPMQWKEDWPIIGIPKNGEEWGEPVDCYLKPDVGAKAAICAAAFRESAPDLSLQWNANPQKGWRRERGGGICLNAVLKDGVYGDIPNLLLKKWSAPEFSCVYFFVLSSLTSGDEAGMISMGMEYGALSFVRDEERIRIFRVHGKQIFGKILCERTEEKKEEIGELPADTDRVFISYSVEQKGERTLGEDPIRYPEETVCMLYGTDKAEFSEGLTMTASPGRWVGVKYGFFCCSAKEESEGHVTILPAL
ncbi:MAG: family 43 glycosylhydrolase [Lachnospiraceae bacterium]|nr:family 43 glycosylhydrolase [Lachnospiraceae bacterium]